MSGGFVDLRRGPELDRAHESFWPSFTDIMMVVMMIFMIASTVLILRNWELVDELRETINAEHRAAEMVRTTTEVNATLEEQLAQLQHQLSVLRMQLMQANENQQAQGQALAARDKLILALESERDQLQAAHQSTRRRLDSVSEELARKQDDLSQLQLRHQETRQRLQTIQTTLTRLEQTHQTQTAELGQLRQQGAEAKQRLSGLQGNYDSLKVRYDKLVKPARTAKGKHVVEVRFEKIKGVHRIGFREPGQKVYRSLQRNQLEVRLGKLKAQHPNKLYVKIVIPADSGLSYAEAWEFTKDLLDKYDYYHD